MNKFQLKTGLTLMITAILTGCVSNPEQADKPQADSSSAITSAQQQAMASARESAQEELIRHILNPNITDEQLKPALNTRNLNQPDNKSISPFAYIVATRSSDLVRYAIQQGANLDWSMNKKVQAGQFTEQVYDWDLLEFTQNVFQLNSAGLQKTKQQFGLQSTTAVRQGVLPISQAARLVENFALIKAKQFELNYPPIQKLQTDYQVWSKQTEAQIKQLSQPITEIPEPLLPPLETHQKSPFESLAMFQQRMETAKNQRDAQTAQLQNDYRKKVEARNLQVAKQTAELKKLQADIEQRNRLYDAQLKTHLTQLEQDLKAKQQDFIAESMSAVYGAPYLAAIEQNGAPKYDPERGLMFAELGFSGVATKHEVVLPVKPGQEAERFYNQLKAGELRPTAVFRFANAQSNQVEFVKAEVKQGQQTFVANLNQNERFIAQPAVEVVLQTTDSAPQLSQNQVVFDQAALTQLTLQNPNIKDVQFEAFLMQEQQAFKDDIPQLLANAPQAPIDRSKWLFVIGIEKYDQTDNIQFSRRSAELFSQVASRTLGVHESRRVVLLDSQASSGRIQDELRLMLSKVREGDQIYFYYSGHGLPVPEKSNAPFILPSDKIPDFIASDDFYQVDSIYRLLQNSQASSVMAFMDSCFTGQTDGRSVFGGTKAATRLQPKQTRFDSTGKVAILTAGNDQQFSNALPETGHRLFSYYLMRTMLEGRYQQVGDLAERVRVEVNDKSLDLGGLNRQTPVFTGNPSLGL